MNTRELFNEILKLVGSCNTCKWGNEDINKVDEGESYCYMFTDKPLNCKHHDPVDNPLEHFVNIELNKETPDEN